MRPAAPIFCPSAQVSDDKMELAVFRRIGKAGVEFVAENGGEPGVRLNKARHTATKPKKGD